MMLTSPKGERFEFIPAPSSASHGAVNKLKGIPMADIRVVGEYPDVFPEELLGMPPD